MSNSGSDWFAIRVGANEVGCLVFVEGVVRVGSMRMLSSSLSLVSVVCRKWNWSQAIFGVHFALVNWFK